jgi:D-aminopeptidase
MKVLWKAGTALTCLLAMGSPLLAQTQQRARDLNVPFDGTPGPLNAITDVPGVEVGTTTLISGEGKLNVGKGPVRTGVTAILPRGKNFKDPVFAGFYSQNGNGEMTGIHWVKESGFMEGPVMITNTHSVGTVRDSVIDWEMKHGATQYPWSLPVVAETYDGFLNDINGFHVTHDDTWHAIDTAMTGRVAEGNVGGGTGMRCFGFKGGTGTASRMLTASQGGYVIGVLVQCNTGSAHDLRIAGVPVGQALHQDRRAELSYGADHVDTGSIIIVIATNAPLTAAQLDRLCRRATLGLGRVGGTSGDGSGDIFVSFSTANPGADSAQPPFQQGAAASPTPPPVAQIGMLPNWAMSPLFDATVQATEEAIVNAMVGAQTMTGINGNTIKAVPHEDLQRLMGEQHPVTAW